MGQSPVRECQVDECSVVVLADDGVCLSGAPFHSHHHASESTGGERVIELVDTVSMHRHVTVL